MFFLPDQFNVVSHFLEANLRERPDKVVIECDHQITYRQLYENVNRTGNLLRQACGIQRQQVVAVLLLDCPEFFYCFLGTIKIGAIAVPLNTMLTAADYEFILNDCCARVLIVSDALWPKIQEIPRERLSCLQQIIVAGQQLPGTHQFSEMLAAHSPQLEAALTHKDEPAFWLYSSGSTGRSKGCIHLHHDMVVCAEQYAKAVLQMQESDRCFSVSKLFFAYGLGNALYFPLAVGATSILWPGRSHPSDIFAIIERFRPTLFFSVPSNFAALLAFRREDGSDFDLSRLRYAISAGESLPAATFHRFKERFRVEILDAIGSTEALHMFISNRPGAVRPGSSGQTIPGCEAQIVDEEGEPLPVGEIGNLLIKSDATCAGYWNQSEKTKQTFVGEWLKTGDKYRQDRDGYFWYEGRSDDMLKVSGMWVSPIEIENTLVEHPAVLEAAVVGRTDLDSLVKPAAFVVPANGVQPSEALAHELRQFVASRIAHYKRPRWVEFVSELPKTATGKIQRYKLRERQVGTC